MRVTLLIAAAALLAAPAFAQVTYESGPLAMAIPDGGPGCGPFGVAASHSIVVADAGTVTDVDVRLNISHTWIGDVVVVLDNGTVTDTLLHKPGTTLSTGCGDSSDGANFFIDDEGTDGTTEDAPAGPGGAEPAYTDMGRYTSYGDDGTVMSAFDGQPAAGTWTITVFDTGGGDTGNLEDWALILDGVVPVELVSFNAQANGNNVNLMWETASETNNAGFEVQALRGDSWEVLGFVDGHGTTTEARTYDYTAEGMGVGTHAFRLKQIDFDGAFEYSAEVEATIETPGSHQISAAYPNPFNPQSQFTLSVAQDQQVSVELFNTLGQRVATLFQGTVEANEVQTLTIDGAGLASGLYVVRVNGERFSDALNVTLLK